MSEVRHLTLRPPFIFARSWVNKVLEGLAHFFWLRQHSRFRHSSRVNWEVFAYFISKISY